MALANYLALYAPPRTVAAGSDRRHQGLALLAERDQLRACAGFQKESSDRFAIASLAGPVGLLEGIS